MSLEDEFSDVIAKAMAGLELNSEELSQRSGVSRCEVEGLLHGDMEEQSLRHIATDLGLDAEAMLNMQTYTPAPLEISGISRFELPFRQWTVNAWGVRKNDEFLLFDTGLGRTDITEALDGEIPSMVFITHAHPDHTGGIEALKKSGVKIISEKEALSEGSFQFGGLAVRAVDLAGHCEPAAGFMVSGLGQKLLISGDAIFAGSIGRCRSKRTYELALETLREVLAETEPDCIILPGHGPATTVREEMKYNPFKLSFS